MAVTAHASSLSPPRSHREMALAVLLGLAIIGALLAMPMQAAIALAIVAAFCVYVLFDTWHAVLLLFVTRSSLDVLSDVQIIGGLNGAALLTAIVIVVCLEYIVRRRIQVLDIPIAKPLLALLALSAVTVVIAPDARLAFEHWIRSLSTFLLFILISDVVRDERQRGKFLNAILLSATLPIAVGLYQAVTGEGNHATEGFNRIYGTLVHPSPYGFYLLTLLPIAVVLWFHAPSGWSKVGLCILTIGMFVCALLTFSRIVWIGMVVIALVMGSAKTRATLLFIPLVVVAAFMLLPSVQQRFEGATTTTGYESTAAWRIRHWGDQIAYTSPSRLPLGSGLGAVDALFEDPAHNEYLRIWTEMGIAGSAVFLWLYGAVLHSTLISYRHARSARDRNLILAFLALFAGRLVMSLTDNLLIMPVLEWYFWGLVALTLSLAPRSHAFAPASPPDSGAGARLNRFSGSGSLHGNGRTVAAANGRHGSQYSGD